MRRTPLLLTAAALALGSFAFGCMPAVTAVPSSTVPAGIAPRSVEDSIGEVATAWVNAYATGDTIAAARILDDQFVALGADGTSRTKPALLHVMSDGPRVEAGGVFEKRVQRAGDMGIVLTRSWWGRRDSEPRRGALYRTTDVFIRRTDGWRLLSEQVALVQPTRIMPQDSIDAAHALRQMLESARSAGRSHSLIVNRDGSMSAFAAQLPYRMDEAEVPERALSIIDAPRSEYIDSGLPSADPFIPERLRLQMLSPDAAVATFELQNGDSIGRRTMVLRRNHGVWSLAHVHASSVPRRSAPSTAQCARITRMQPAAPLVDNVLPSRRPPGPGLSGVVGIVSDAVTGVRIPSAIVVIGRVAGGDPDMRGDVLETDSTGVFEATLPAGRYSVAVRRILYDPASDTITVRPTRDTLRIRLAYRKCLGP